MPVNIGQLFVRNWPIKLAAMFFAVMLYVAVAAQQPLSQRFALRLAVTVPPGRAVRQQPAGVTVTVTGKGSEIMKLRSFPRTIRKTISDTFSGSVWSIHLQASDVDIPKGTDVQVVEITPRDVDVVLDPVGKKDVRIVPLVRVEAESGYVLRGLSIVPSVARVVGPEKSLAAVDSITTLPTVISSVNGPFFRTVPLDTTPLGVVRVAPKEVRVAGEVAAIVERSIGAVPITTAASGFAGFLLTPERVATPVSASPRRPGSGRAPCPTPSGCGARRAVADVVLGIETSCDETSAAVLVAERAGRPPELASLVILSQDIHKVFGGVVPELASRAHLAALPAVVERALVEAGIGWSALDAVAVTQGPGLVGALLVGVVYAKALAYAGDRAVIGVHHMEGHLFAPALEDPELAPPFAPRSCWAAVSPAAAPSRPAPPSDSPAWRASPSRAPG